MRLGTIAFLLGIVIFQQLPLLPDSRWAALILFSLPLSLGIIPAGNLSRLSLRLLGWGMTGFLLTLLHASDILSSSLAHQLQGRDLLVDGVIATIPEQREHSSRFEFEIKDVLDNDVSLDMLPRRIRLNWYRALPELHVDDKWRLVVRLKQAHGFMNPGGFDYEAWLFRHGIRATGYVRQSNNNRLLEQTAAYSLDRWRERLTGAIDHALPQSQAKGIITALAIGQRDAISNQQWQVLIKTGTNHLVAISGLHIGLVSGLVFLLVRWCWCRSSILLTAWPASKAAAIAAISAALIYAALAGFSIPTQRALIMVCVFMASFLLQRFHRPADGLALAMLLVLVLDPLAVMDAGFWLSFAAVAIILFAMSGRLSGTGVWWKWGRIHLVIGIALAPLTLLLFQQASLISPLANLIAVPFISLLIVPLVLIGTLLIISLPSLGTLFLQLADWSLDLAWPWLESFSELGFSQVHYSIMSPWLIIPVLIAMAWLMAPRGWPGRWLGGVWLAALFLLPQQRPEWGEAWVTLLDVGQGLAAVVQTQSHLLVYDTGPRFSEHFDTGDAVVLPFLRQQGLNKIDTLVVSHGDNDHIGGVASVIDSMTIDSVISSVPGQLAGVAAGYCYSGQVWQWDGVDFEVLNPSYEIALSENDNSCVMKVTTAGSSLLLTGDIEKRTEKRLLASQRQRLSADILVVPHHGSKTSSHPDFIDAVSPRYALIPAGYRNRFRLPRPEVVARYQLRGIEVLQTGLVGGLKILLGKDEITPPLAYRDENRHYWTHLPLNRLRTGAEK